ncbi:MAG: TonB family protein [Acidobacteriaceae bacterium]
MRRAIVVGCALALGMAAAAQETPTPAQPDSSAQQTATAPGTATVPSGVLAGMRTGGEVPKYPPIAKAARVQGSVVLQATISKEGTIEDLHVISGPPMLQAAAMEAVRTWTYKPYLLNGQPVKVMTQIHVIFSLGKGGPVAPPDETNVQAPEPSSPDAAASQSQQSMQVLGAAVPPGTTPDDLKPPENPITAEQTQELMQLTGMAAMQRKMMDGLMPILRQSMPPYMPEDVLTDFEDRLVGGDMQALVVQSYQKHFSQEDADAMIAFYKTPAGRRAILMMPVLMKELQDGGAHLGQETMQKVLEAHHLEIEQAKQKYEQEHPWAPPKSQ